jgi:AcrR family transcriptional regulator
MDGPNASTRLRLIATAEQLFGDRGIHAVSAREIATAADQRNTNAVKYHFGGKQQLVDAIFEHRMVPLNARRLALIAEFDRHGRTHDPYAIAEAFVLPLAEFLEQAAPDSWYLRFCVQSVYTVHPDVATPDLAALGRQSWTKGLMVLHERTLHVCADLPAWLAEQRWSLFSGFVAHALAEREMRARHGVLAVDDSHRRFVAGLVDAAAAMLITTPRATTLAHTADAAHSIHDAAALSVHDAAGTA